MFHVKQMCVLGRNVSRETHNRKNASWNQPKKKKVSRETSPRWGIVSREILVFIRVSLKLQHMLLDIVQGVLFWVLL